MIYVGGHHRRLIGMGYGSNKVTTGGALGFFWDVTPVASSYVFMSFQFHFLRYAYKYNKMTTLFEGGISSTFCQARQPLKPNLSGLVADW